MSQTITAIVPTYNRAVYLAEALAAIAGQTRPVDEIIVWDDGSSDATETVARAAAGPVRYFKSANGGKSRALNAAMAEATGSLIWICDDDDIALPHAAETLGALLGAHPEAGVAGASYRRFQSDPESGTRIEQGPGYWPDLSQGSVLRHLLEDIFLFQNATLVRRSAYDAVGAFREDLPRSIDYDMIIRLALHTTVVMTQETVFLQRKHDGLRGPAAARHAADRSDEIWAAAGLCLRASHRLGSRLHGFQRCRGGGTGHTAERSGGRDLSACNGGQARHRSGDDAQDAGCFERSCPVRPCGCCHRACPAPGAALAAARRCCGAASCRHRRPRAIGPDPVARASTNDQHAHGTGD